jgi:hypothetical protein
MSGGEVWNVLTMKDGVVSLLKNLSADECRAVVQRVKGGDPWSQGRIYRRVLANLGRDPNPTPSLLSGVWISHPGDSEPVPGFGVDRCEWWGSEGGELEIWPEPADYAERLAEAMRVAEMVKATNSKIAA